MSNFDTLILSMSYRTRFVLYFLASPYPYWYTFMPRNTERNNTALYTWYTSSPLARIVWSLSIDYCCILPGKSQVKRYMLT